MLAAPMMLMLDPRMQQGRCLSGVEAGIQNKATVRAFVVVTNRTMLGRLTTSKRHGKYIAQYCYHAVLTMRHQSPNRYTALGVPESDSNNIKAYIQQSC